LVELIAHRGMPRLARENTLASFELALKHGADAIELDVHISADAAVVVHHDETLPDAKATPLASLTAQELSRLGIPTLDEVCELVGEKVVLYVEAKAPKSAAAIVDCLTRNRVRAAVHSFDYRVVDTIRSLAPGLPLGLLVANDDADIVLLARDHAVRDVWPAVDLVDAPLIDSLHAIGARVIAWTANDVNDARRLQQAGVDGICTDDVRLMRSALLV
jgi:glycerophosphoryl diester phosphodiesterase